MQRAAANRNARPNHRALTGGPRALPLAEALPRESLEWVGPLTVTANGTATTAYAVSVVATNTRPTVWLSPDLLSGQQGVLVGPGGTWPVVPGGYEIWVRVVTSTESIVLDNVGSILIT